MLYNKRSKKISCLFHSMSFRITDLICLLTVNLGLDSCYILKHYEVDSRWVYKMEVSYDL